MNESLNALIKYRLNRAQETFEEAVLMSRENHWNACLNRLYYACFYSVTALLAKHGLWASKHSGVKSLFNQHFIKTGKTEKRYGALFNHLFETRQEGDYVDFVVFEAAAVKPLIEQVQRFILAVGRQAKN